jgi:hypothetical protein
MKMLERLRANFSRRGSPGEPPRVAFPGTDGKPFPALASIVQSYDKDGPKHPVLIFGDSVMERVSRDDTDNRTLGDMIAAALKEPALCVSRSAFNPAIYRGLAAVLERAAARPRKVVLPVNLRCFSPQWDLHPAWQLTGELSAVDDYLRKGTIPAIDDVIEGPSFFRNYDVARVNCPLSRHATAGEFRELIHSAPEGIPQRNERAREIFNFHYACAFAHDHRKARELARSVELLTKLRCNTLVYLTPINVEAGTRLAGTEWLSAVKENVRRILEVLGGTSSAWLRVRDWSDVFSSAHFFHDDLATEHLNQQGRAALAGLVAAELEACDGA